MEVCSRIKILEHGRGRKGANGGKPTFFSLLPQHIRTMQVRDVLLQPKAPPGSTSKLAHQAFVTMFDKGLEKGYFRSDPAAPSYTHADGPSDEAVSDTLPSRNTLPSRDICVHLTESLGTYILRGAQVPPDGSCDSKSEIGNIT